MVTPPVMPGSRAGARRRDLPPADADRPAAIRRASGRAAASRARQAESGTLTLFAAIAGIGLIATAAFAADAGQKLAASEQARAVAEEAARAGAGQVSASAAYARRGPFRIDPGQAEAAAAAYLSRSGHTGSVTVTGDQSVRVTVTITVPAVLIPLGVTHLTATQTATATLVQGITGPQQ